MRIILTGGTGYLGMNILQRLVKLGYEVLCICLPGTTDKIENNSELLGKYSILFTDNPDYEKIILEFKANTVIHTAGVYENHENNLLKVISGNFDFPIRLLDIVRKNGTIRWINTCTSLPENLNSYTLSKYMFSHWGNYYSQLFDISFNNFKLEHFYGPNEIDSKFISFVYNRLINDLPIDLTIGTQRRDFIHIEDVCRAYLLLLETDIKGYIDIPVGTGIAPSIREVVEYLKEITKSNSKINYGAIPLRKNEPMLCIADLSIISKYGFVPKFDWRTGMSTMIKEMVS